MEDQPALDPQSSRSILLNRGCGQLVADAAERFGQKDDISVIIVTRTAVLEPAVA